VVADMPNGPVQSLRNQIEFGEKRLNEYKKDSAERLAKHEDRLEQLRSTLAVLESIEKQRSS
jgi:uncharacterized protein (DUF342 family)